MANKISVNLSSIFSTLATLEIKLEAMLEELATKTKNDYEYVFNH